MVEPLIYRTVVNETVQRLADGLDTEIGEGGVGLVVGERQRIQLARALAAQPRILILDEATANVDYATEAEIKTALATMRGQRTTLVIAETVHPDLRGRRDEGRFEERLHPRPPPIRGSAHGGGNDYRLNPDQPPHPLSAFITA